MPFIKGANNKSFIVYPKNLGFWAKTKTFLSNESQPATLEDYKGSAMLYSPILLGT